MAGQFVISLDFEGMWGFVGGISENQLKQFRKYIAQDELIVTKLLNLFAKYNIHATWAIVGAMLCSSPKEVLSYLNKDICYSNWKISMMQFINEITDKDAYFMQDLVKKVASQKSQEIGTHMFTHYYANEKGGSYNLLVQELKASTKIFGCIGIKPKAIVLPRNQVPDYVHDAMKECGYFVIRSQCKNYRPTKKGILNTILNFADAYFPLFKRSYKIEDIHPLELPASSFYRTWFKKLFLFEFFKLIRIKYAMTIAARNGECYHLWFHPHNMATNIEANFKTLEKILAHYQKLNLKYGFQSMTMSEATSNR